jgi:hypothetical protein
MLIVFIGLGVLLFIVLIILLMSVHLEAKQEEKRIVNYYNDMRDPESKLFS